MKDEIIAAVRATREAHAAKFNFDLDTIYEDIKRSEAEYLAHGGKFVDPPAPTPGITHSDYQKIRFGELSEQT